MIHRMKSFALFAAAVLCGVLLTACGFVDGKFALNFSAMQIQSAIEPKFPKENCPTPVTCLKLQNPKVSLTENSDRITMAFDTSVTVLQQAFTGTAIVSAKPRYQTTTGEIFLDDSKIEDLKLQGLSEKAANTAVQYGSLIAQTALQRTPIYTFKDGKADKLAKMGIADVKVVDGKLRVLLDPSLRATEP
jgi:hypothetical protein